MVKGKRYDKKVNNNIGIKLIVFVLVIFVILSTVFIVFYINDKSKSDTVDNPIDSTIEITKKIVGLEYIEITSMNIKSSAQSSTIEISFKNISDTKIDSCEISLYLLDENDLVIFGTSLELPDIEPNSFETFNVLCSDNITNISDYKVVLDK